MNKDENKGGAKYTRLTADDINAIMERARENAAPFIDPADFDGRFGLVTVEEYNERPGTFFVNYSAETWRKAEAFAAAVCGAAWALGHFAEVQTRWRDRIGGAADGRRLVSVYVAAADVMDDDVMDEDGHAVA